MIFLVLSPIENQTSTKNFDYNKNNPFPSLNTYAKPPIYVQHQINKYSAFPSLNTTTLNYHQKPKEQPYDAFNLDKFRKTKLW